MADIPNAAPTDTNNETQIPSITEEITTSPVSPTQVSPEPLYYVTGEARVTRTRRRITGSPRADPYSNPDTIGDTSTRARRRAYARRWNWLPTTLNTWRSEEGIQTPTESMDISPYTQEPIHHTVPVLAARMHRHEGRLDDLEREQHVVQMHWLRQAHDRIAQFHRGQEDLTQTMEMIHQQVIDDRSEVDMLQARLEQSELRSQEAEQYTLMLEQRLTMAEENVRQASRLAESVDHLISLLPQLNLHQN